MQKFSDVKQYTTRSITAAKIFEVDTYNLSTATFTSDSIRAWNKAPAASKNTTTETIE